MKLDSQGLPMAFKWNSRDGYNPDRDRLVFDTDDYKHVAKRSVDSFC